MKNDRIKIITRIIAGLLMLQLCGFYGPCSGAWKTFEDPNPTEANAQVVTLDIKRNLDLRVTGVRGQRLPSGQMEVTVAIENLWAKDVWVDAQTVFTDSGGFEIESTNWQPLHLEGRAITTYRSNSITGNATDFRVRIRDNQ